MDEPKPKKRRGPPKPIYYVVDYEYDRHTGEEGVSVHRYDELPECCRLPTGPSQSPTFSAPWTEEARSRIFTHVYGGFAGYMGKPIVARIGEDDETEAWLCYLIDLPPWRKRKPRPKP